MGGVYYYSERGDRLIDLDAFHDKLWQVIFCYSFLMSYLAVKLLIMCKKLVYKYINLSYLHAVINPDLINK